MDIRLLEQAGALIESSKTPVIIIPNQPSSDALAAGLALLLVLERLGKQAKIVCAEFQLPSSHAFLPKSNAIEHDLSSLQSFVLSVNVKDTKLDSLSYTIDKDELHIYLNPKKGFYRAEDVRTSSGGFAFDLIITLDAPSLESLGELYTQNADFFYHTPLLNIDHHPSNGRYGHVNAVDVVATSVSEIIFELIKRLGVEHLDEQVATSLLTGIISKTKIFQTNAVTPRSLAIASHLVTSGARRDDIIKNLYQTKNVQTLKLWGRALTRLKSSSDQKAIWATVYAADLQDLKATTADAVGVLDELMVNAPTLPYVILFVENGDGVEISINVAEGTQVPELPKEISQTAPLCYSGKLPGKPGEVAEKVLRALGVTFNPSSTRPEPRRG